LGSVIVGDFEVHQQEGENRSEPARIGGALISIRLRGGASNRAPRNKQTVTTPYE
jgi:hypothetical protein